MKYLPASLALVSFLCGVPDAQAVENGQGQCKASDVSSMKLMVVFNPNGEGQNWKFNPAGMFGTDRLKNMFPALSSRLPIVFGCNGITARFPSADGEKNMLGTDEYILSTKPVSAYTSSRVGSTVTIGLDLLSPPPRKIVWHSFYTFGPASPLALFRSAEENEDIAADRLSNFLLGSLRGMYQPPGPLVDFHGEPLKLNPRMRDTGYAGLNDAAAIPYLDEKGRAAYGAYLEKKSPRAFAIAPNGAFGWSSGRREDNDERAIEHCNQDGDGQCKLYSVDEKVVWVKEVQAPESVSSNR